MFYGELQKKLNIYNNMDHVVIAGDLNARIGNQAIKNVNGIFFRRSY